MTDVQLCNLTTSLLKVQRIEAMDDNSEVAHMCSEYLQPCIDEVLTEHHNFSFSVTHTTLETALAETYRDYAYLYALPTGFLQPVEYVDLENGDYELTSHGLASDSESLELVYVKQITDVELFPVKFAKAVAYLLALTIGPIIAPGQKDTIELAGALYSRHYQSAANLDGRMNTLSVQGSYTLLED